MSVIAKANVNIQISDALDKLSIRYKQWIRLQKMTEEKLDTRNNPSPLRL